MVEVIRMFLSHIPVVMFIAALAAAFFLKTPSNFQSRLLGLMLLLSVGVEATWAGLFHVLFPQVAAISIGWEISPFQFEIGIADIAIGVTAILSFWRSWLYKEATIIYVTLFYAGVTIGHVREAVMSDDYSANNFGLLLLINVIKVFLLPALYFMAPKDESV